MQNESVASSDTSSSRARAAEIEVEIRAVQESLEQASVTAVVASIGTHRTKLNIVGDELKTS